MKSKITGDGNWTFGALSLGAFGDGKYHIMARPMICDYILTLIVRDSKSS